MKELLALLPKPSRYLGSEWGAAHKDLASVRVRLGLAFPDLYEVAMSYMGQRLLYEAVNSHDQFWAERVFSPCKETGEILREHNAPLATLESDTPLGELDAIAFSLTHELCYTNVLYMLDLAGIPLKSADRSEHDPLIMAGGGACFNAEPMADYFDCMVLGDGEEIVVRIMEVLEQTKAENLDRAATLDALRQLPGIYIPALFEGQGPNAPTPLVEGYERVEKAIIDDLDAIPLPTLSPVPFGAVHDRLTMEIARGCTRGCRFCQAGMIYRPVRERKLDTLQNALQQGLAATGWEETSFLSLSTGDYSALDTLFTRTFDRCASEQVSISLPSLRVGSLSSGIMARMASIRRTGATLAPEAGSQRLRDVINKGVDEEALLDHVRLLFENGWHSVKLYFMIGLPTETYEDLDGIVELCRKVRDAAGWDVKRLQVTAAVSPFVPKPHTPFQWDAQLTQDEMRDRLSYLREQFKRYKRINFKHHIPKMSYLEGIFSRGDRRLGPVIERAYKDGALFSSWKDHLDMVPYLNALEAEGLEPDAFLKARDPNESLPWDHLTSGLTKRFLLKERERALAEKITDDCRYHTCRNCGVCTHDGRTSELTAQNDKDIHPRVVFSERDQESSEATPPPPEAHDDLNAKGSHVRLWFEKTGPAAYLSQLDLLAVFERAFRRACLPLSFSAGFHPMPRISFGRALPVGVESSSEWMNIFFRKEFTTDEILNGLQQQLPLGMKALAVEDIGPSKKQPQPSYELYEIEFRDGNGAQRQQEWLDLLDAKSHMVERKTKKGTRVVDVRPFVAWLRLEGENKLLIAFDWTDSYFNPLRFLEAINPGLTITQARMLKLRQSFKPIDE